MDHGPWKDQLDGVMTKTRRMRTRFCPGPPSPPRFYSLKPSLVEVSELVCDVMPIFGILAFQLRGGGHKRCVRGRCSSNLLSLQSSKGTDHRPLLTRRYG